MNSRALLPVAIALAVGIAIGVALKPDSFEAESPQEQAQSTPEHSDRLDSPASAPTARSKPDFPARAKPEPPRSPAASNADAARRDEGEPPRDEFASSARADEENGGAAYRDDTFGPDEASLPFPPAVDEARAAADYEEYGDGPVRRNAPKPGDRRARDERAANGPREELEADTCLPEFSACRKDTDCCGSSVCRSRPGTISGYFECTAS